MLECHELGYAPLQSLLQRFGLGLQLIEDGAAIPGSWFGEPEAGVIGTTLYVRGDTPVHSALHEACHVICMDAERRAALHTNVGGDYDEENAVCYLQILLADNLPGFGRAMAMANMDAWGYSFRLGSAQAWFENDADDARQWLQKHQLIDKLCSPTWRLRR